MIESMSGRRSPSRRFAQRGRGRCTDVSCVAQSNSITVNHILMPNTGRLDRKERHAASKALLGAALLYLVPGLLYWPVAGLKFDLNDWVRIVGCGLLAAMGVWARWAPLRPAIICSASYALLLGVQIYQGLRWNLIIGILHGSIIALLLVSLFVAMKQRVERPATDVDAA
jgi:hypothetical protein